MELSTTLARWVLYSGSFTKRMAEFLPNTKTSIEIICEGQTLLSEFSSEYHCLRSQYVYQREIKICLDNEVLMFAKSIVPKNAPLFFKQQFRKLGEQPLGGILFRSPSFYRSAFQLAKIYQDATEDRAIDLATGLTFPFLWGRRSVFSAEVPLLLLTEIFAPGLVKLINRYEHNLQN
jgi:chorismate-pyruvate lyase